MKKDVVGVTLIETLISLLLLSLILLGFDAMQLFAMRESLTAYHFSVAENQLYLMIERLRTPNSFSYWDQWITAWNKQNQDVLPNGYGQIAGSYPVYRLTISWAKNTLSQQVLL